MIGVLGKRLTPGGFCWSPDDFAVIPFTRAPEVLGKELKASRLHRRPVHAAFVRR